MDYSITSMTLAEQLGYPCDAKILIVQADDLGMAHSVNTASIKAIDAGLVNSASIMVPCPYFADITKYLRANPEADYGLHLTLTSEWPSYRWKPLLPEDRISSLLDFDGNFYSTSEESGRHINPVEAEAEIQAQIDRAFDFGLHPTYLDSHMFSLYQNEDLFEVFVRAGSKNNIPVLVFKDVLDWMKLPASLLGPNVLLIENTLRIKGSMRLSPKCRDEFYINSLEQLQPGITVMIVHLAYDNEEMQSVTQDIKPFGSEWRQQDLDFISSSKFLQSLQENNIKTTNWREICHRLKDTQIDIKVE